MADAFPDNQWTTLKVRMESDGPEQVIAFIETFDEDRRVALYQFARKGFAFQDWEGKNWDGHIAVCCAGIEEMLRQDCVEQANLLAYNLAADLAPCWPGDDMVRETHHFEVGVDLADNCLQWRADLEKGPDAFSIAHWVRGIHLLALECAEDAAEAFGESFDCAIEDAEANGSPSGVTVDAPDGLVLASGYWGLGQWAANESGGEKRYREAIAIFENKMRVEGADQADLQFYIDQLEKVRQMCLGNDQ